MDLGETGKRTKCLIGVVHYDRNEYWEPKRDDIQSQVYILVYIYIHFYFFIIIDFVFLKNNVELIFFQICPLFIEILKL